MTSAVRRGVSALHIGEGDEELGRVVQIPGPQTVRLPLPQPRTGGGERRSLHVSPQSARVVRAHVTTLRIFKAVRSVGRKAVVMSVLVGSLEVNVF